jgi:membrane-associated protein
MEHLLRLLEHYQYVILFPLAIIEGPIVTILAGFLCSGGQMNPLWAFPLIIAGDLIGDSLYFGLGRWGGPHLVKRAGRWLGLTPQKLDRVRVFFDAHPTQTISLSKIILGIGVAGLFLAGHARVSFNKFLRICIWTSACQCAVYLCIGWLFGRAYVQINHYLNYVATICIVAGIALVLFFTIKTMSKKI